MQSKQLKRKSAIIEEVWEKEQEKKTTAQSQSCERLIAASGHKTNLTFTYLLRFISYLKCFGFFFPQEKVKALVEKQVRRPV